MSVILLESLLLVLVANSALSGLVPRTIPEGNTVRLIPIADNQYTFSIQHLDGTVLEEIVEKIPNGQFYVKGRLSQPAFNPAKRVIIDYEPSANGGQTQYIYEESPVQNYLPALAKRKPSTPPNPSYFPESSELFKDPREKYPFGPPTLLDENQQKPQPISLPLIENPNLNPKLTYLDQYQQKQPAQPIGSPNYFPFPNPNLPPLSDSRKPYPSPFMHLTGKQEKPSPNSIPSGPVLDWRYPPKNELSHFPPYGRLDGDPRTAKAAEPTPLKDEKQLLQAKPPGKE